jgi:plastocyanin
MKGAQLLIFGIVGAFVITSLILLMTGNRKVTITLTKDGYRPAVVTISPGTIVTFTTSLRDNFWPASDFHPVHDILPEFDPKRPLKPGERWSFTFTKTGTWKFHDHISPQQRGKILVKDRKGFIGATTTQKVTFKDCEGKKEINERQSCWDQVFRGIVEDTGVDAAFSSFDALYEKDADFRVHCHRQAHILGLEAYEQYSVGKRFTLTPSTSLCGYGFYHGFMQEFVSHKRNHAQARNFCEEVHNTVDVNEAESILNMCYHGIGHGLVYEQATEHWGDLQTIIDNSLKDCESIVPEDYMHDCIYGAYGGVESFFFGLHGYRLSVEKDDPFKVCREQQSRFRPYCHNAMVPAIYGALGFERTAHFIEKIDDDASAQIAVEHLGLLFNKFGVKTGEQDLTQYISLCKSLQPRLQRFCVAGFATYYIQARNIDSVHDSARVCNHLLLTTEEADFCWERTVKRVEELFNAPDTESVCYEIKQSYGQTCQKKST